MTAENEGAAVILSAMPEVNDSPRRHGDHGEDKEKTKLRVLRASVVNKSPRYEEDL
jgi:hypothetical protein